MRKLNIHLIAAARPNFMKIAPLYHSLTNADWAHVEIVHTGQHYDFNMSDAFFVDLGLPAPHFHLGVKASTHAQQTANVMIEYENLIHQKKPDLVIVVGDVNSTLACALVCAKEYVPIAHLEAGLRSFDRRMPEEINRIVTDAISDVLWTPSSDADENLLKEGISRSKIVRVGNIMIDSYELLKDRIDGSSYTEKLDLQEKKYIVVTLHRPSNVDDHEKLEKIARNLIDISREYRIIFPVHPRTSKNLARLDVYEKIKNNKNITLIDPVGYIDFMHLVKGTKFIITDSGGVQEETTYINIPCLTLRDNTERPITVEQGTNILVNTETLAGEVAKIINGNYKTAICPDMWDGQTAKRVVTDIRSRFVDK